MSTLWTLGDSHTAGHGSTPGFEYCDNYRKEGDRIWPQHLAERMGMELSNIGENGCSNDTIIDRVIEYWDSFKEGDTVIIGKTYGHRLDIPNPKPSPKREWLSIFYHWVQWTQTDPTKKDWREMITEEGFNSLQSYIENWRFNPLYDVRYMRIFTHYQKILNDRGVRCIIWDCEIDLVSLPTIRHATKGEIDDGHLSFEGHKIWADRLYKRINKPLI